MRVIRVHPAQRALTLALALSMLLAYPVKAAPASPLTVVDSISPGRSGSGAMDSGPVVAFKDWIYFSATGVNEGDVTGYELWRSNGTTTQLVQNIAPFGDSSHPSNLTPLGDWLYFTASNQPPHAARYQIYRTNGETTEEVANLDPNRRQASPQYLTGLGDWLYFQASDGPTGWGNPNWHGYELWRTNGVINELVMDIHPTGSSTPAWLTPLGSWLYFSANDGVHGYELWRTNGSSTELVKDINPGSSSSDPNGFIPLDSWLYFSADDGVHGYELWRTNGDTTQLVMDINEGRGSDLGLFTQFESWLYFSAGDGVHGYELWRTNGTATELVRDINAGPYNSYPSGFTPLGPWLYFSASDGVNGTELWRTNGSTTQLVRNIDPTQRSSNPRGFTRFGDWLFFTAHVGTDPRNWTLWRTDGVTTEPIPLESGATMDCFGSCNDGMLTVAGDKLFTLFNSISKGREFAWMPAAVRAIATVKPTVTGTFRVGQTLTASKGTWGGYPTPTFTYQWYVCHTAIISVRTTVLSGWCGKIPGATRSTYKLTSAQRGKYVTVLVTGRSAGTTATSWLAKSISRVK